MMTNQIDIDERLWELWKEAQEKANPKDAYAGALEAEVQALHARIATLEAAGDAVNTFVQRDGMCPACMADIETEPHCDGRLSDGTAAPCPFERLTTALAPAPEGTG